MESVVVNKIPNENSPLESADSILLIENYFKENLPKFALKDKGHYTAYWWAEFVNGPVNIFFNGDERTGFSVDITIDNTKYSLWQYDRRVNEASAMTSKNLLYQLETVKRFLTEKSGLASDSF